MDEANGELSDLANERLKVINADTNLVVKASNSDGWMQILQPIIRNSCMLVKSLALWERCALEFTTKLSCHLGKF